MSDEEFERYALAFYIVTRHRSVGLRVNGPLRPARRARSSIRLVFGTAGPLRANNWRISGLVRNALSFALAATFSRAVDCVLTPATVATTVWSPSGSAGGTTTLI